MILSVLEELRAGAWVVERALHCELSIFKLFLELQLISHVALIRSLPFSISGLKQKNYTIKGMNYMIFNHLNFYLL